MTLKGAVMFTKFVLSVALVAMLSWVSVAQDGAETLRARGPQALDELLARRDALVERRVSDADLAALDALIDAVGGQKYCSATRLYWYTDFEKAKAASATTGKPILSLRLLGKLTDEFCCANSRFFRATLYVNREIAQLMRTRYVLHWASVRPVPRMTIDFGDGRKLHRTLTGNSIHYVLDGQGNVLDALPGLNSPQAFQQWLTQMAHVGGSVTATVRSAEVMMAIAKSNHVWALNVVGHRWESDLLQLGILALPATLPVPILTPAVPPPAEDAARLATSKSVMEMPTLPSVTMRLARVAALDKNDAWDRIGALHVDEVRFDDATIAFIRSLNPTAGREVADEKAAFDELLAQLRRSVAIDTARNEFDLHRRIHEWLAEATAPVHVDAFNERVYDELFLTPRSDPWIGLLPADAFSGLFENGVEHPR